MMTPEEISNIRIINQKIGTTAFTTAKEIVTWMGAMQAQDYPMAKLGIGVRLLNSTDKKIEAAFNKGEIIRTHVMRPTWHFVCAEDIYWMLDLTAMKIKSSLKSRHKVLDITPELLIQSNLIIEKALLNNAFLTREELANEFIKANISITNNRISHLMFCAELEGLVCSGPLKGKKQTYALLPDRVPYTKKLTRDEALAELAKRYFTSHCPATIHDFVWWSGLSITEARRALDFVQSNFISETIGSEKYWLTNSFSAYQHDSTSIYLLPAFDEFLISYKDRSASLSLTDNRKAVSENGIFRPVVVVNGQVLGLWKRTLKKDKISIDIDFFRPETKLTKENIEKAVETFKTLFGKEIEINV